MPSPFPGMDPYLEAATLWPDFQEQLVAALYQLMVPAVTDRYRIRAGHRDYTTKVVLFTSVTEEPRAEPYLECRLRGDPNLVTVIEVVSPTNKTTSEGRAAYLASRQEALRAGANVVEIDLVLDGKPMLELNRAGLPALDYSVIVTRAVQPDRHEIYTAKLEKPLPRFRLPLSADHRDVLVDLQAAMARAYDQGKFDHRVSYVNDPAVPLADEDRDWLRDLLKRHKLRK